MISIASAQLEAWIAGLLWPLVRMLALFTAAPVLSHRALPARLRILLAVLATALVAPGLPPAPVQPLLSGASLLLLAQQVLIGTAIGFSVRIAFAAVEMAGDLIGLQMGLGYATFFDPQTHADTPILGTFLGMIATLMFLAIDGPFQMFAALVESFSVAPLGADFHASLRWDALAQMGGAMFVLGLQLALPVVTAMLMCNIALGVMARAAPQLNLFSIGFPVTLLGGLVLLALMIGTMQPTIMQAFETGLRVWLR